MCVATQQQSGSVSLHRSGLPCAQQRSGVCLIRGSGRNYIHYIFVYTVQFNSGGSIVSIHSAALPPLRGPLLAAARSDAIVASAVRCGSFKPFDSIHSYRFNKYARLVPDGLGNVMTSAYSAHVSIHWIAGPCLQPPPKKKEKIKNKKTKKKDKITTKQQYQIRGWGEVAIELTLQI